MGDGTGHCIDIVSGGSIDLLRQELVDCQDTLTRTQKDSTLHSLATRPKRLQGYTLHSSVMSQA